MKHDHRSNGTRHHGGRPPPAPNRWRPEGAGAGLVLPTFAEDPTVQGATEEVGWAPALPPRFQSLLVPVDGSPFGEHALPLAVGIARRAGAELRVVHVHCPPRSAYRPESLYYDRGMDGLLQWRRESYLGDLVRRLGKVTPVPVTPVFLQGRDVADSLCQAASTGTDLVVMATHGRSPLGRFWFGSVGNVLMRRLAVPLLLVRGYNAPADLTGDPLVRHVLVPLDGSETAEQVLGPALALSALTRANQTLLRVVAPTTDHSVGYPGPASRETPTQRAQTEAWSYLRHVTGRLGRCAPRIRPALVLDQEPTARAILGYARRHDADLIALATRGRGGLARLFHGSVADRVVRGASVPVLVFRAAPGQEGRATP